MITRAKGTATQKIKAASGAASRPPMTAGNDIPQCIRLYPPLSHPATRPVARPTEQQKVAITLTIVKNGAEPLMPQPGHDRSAPCRTSSPGQDSKRSKLEVQAAESYAGRSPSDKRSP